MRCTLKKRTKNLLILYILGKAIYRIMDELNIGMVE